MVCADSTNTGIQTDQLIKLVYLANCNNEMIDINQFNSSYYKTIFFNVYEELQHCKRCKKTPRIPCFSKYKILSGGNSTATVFLYQKFVEILCLVIHITCGVTLPY